MAENNFDIFIAGAKDLKDMRDICRVTASHVQVLIEEPKVTLTLKDYTDFPNDMKKENDPTHQQEYNKYIRENCDVVIFILDSRLGDITLAEFEVAFKAVNNPERKALSIYTFSREGDQGRIPGLNDIRKRISQLGQYYIEYRDERDFENELYKSLARFITQKVYGKASMPPLIISDQTHFGYDTLIKFNGQTYRPSEDFYIERDIDTAEHQSKVICFSGAPMSGKTRAMVNMANRLYQQISQSPSQRDQTKAEMLIITPQVSERMVENSFKYLKSLEERPTQTNCIVVIDDYDSPLYSRATRSLKNLSLRRTRIPGSHNYLLLSQKAERKEALVDDENPSAWAYRVDSRHIKPLNNNQWREYSLIKTAHYKNAGKNEGNERINLRVMGALFDRHSLQTLRDTLDNLVLAEDNSINVTKIAELIYDLNTVRRVGNFKMDDLAYMYWHYRTNIAKDFKRTDNAAYNEMRQICDKVVNLLLERGMLLGRSDEEEDIVYFDEYLVENVFCPKELYDVSPQEVAKQKALRIKNLSKFLNFRFKVVKDSGEPELTLPVRLMKWTYRQLVATESYDKDNPILARFGQAPILDYVESAYRSLGDNRDNQADIDWEKSISWALRLSSYIIRYTPDFEQALDKRNQLWNWMNQHPDVEGAFFYVDQELLKKPQFAQSDKAFQLIQQSLFQNGNPTLKLNPKYGIVSYNFFGLISPYLTIDQIFQLGDSLLEETSTDTAIGTNTAQGQNDNDEGFDGTAWYDPFDDSLYDSNPEDSDTDKNLDASSKVWFKYQPDTINGLFFNYALRNVKDYDEFERVWRKYQQSDQHTALKSVKLHSWLTLTKNLPTEDVKRLAYWLLSINVDQDEVTQWVLRTAINNCLMALEPEQVSELAQRMTIKMDSFTCTAVIRNLNFNQAMWFFQDKFLPSLAEKETVNIEVFNILLDKSMTFSDDRWVMNLMHQYRYEPSDDQYTLGIALRKDFPIDKKKGWLKEFREKHPWEKLTHTTLGIYTMSLGYKFNELFDMIFGQNPENYGITSEEQQTIIHSEFTLSEVVTKITNQQQLDRFMDELEKRGVKGELLCHPQSNILNKLLKNKVMDQMQYCIDFISDLYKQYPEFSLNKFTINILATKIRDKFNHKNPKYRIPKEIAISETNKIIKLAVEKGLTLSEVFYGRCGIADSCDEVQTFIDGKGNEYADTTFGYFMKNIPSYTGKTDNISGFLIHSVTNPTKNVTNRDKKTIAVLEVINSRGIKFSYEQISRISENLYKSTCWTDDIRRRLESSCHYNDLMKNMVYLLTRQNDLWPWQKTEQEIDSYNSQATSAQRKVIRSVAYWNAVLKNISIKKKNQHQSRSLFMSREGNNFSKEDVEKADEVFNMLVGKGLATAETFASYATLKHNCEQVCELLELVNADDYLSVNSILSNAIMRCDDFDQVVKVLSKYNDKILRISSYMVRCMLLKYVQDKYFCEYTEDLIQNLTDPEVQVINVLNNLHTDAVFSKENLKHKLRNLKPDAALYQCMLPYLTKSEQWLWVAQSMHEQSLEMDEDFAKALIKYAQKDPGRWEEGTRYAWQNKMFVRLPKYNFNQLQELFPTVFS